MRIEKRQITVPGQVTGPACLTGYLLDSISVNPDKLRPAVIVLPGGGYIRRSDRESEPIALQFMSMGCHGFVLDYSVAPNRFPASLRELAEAVAVIREHGGGVEGGHEQDHCMRLFRSRSFSLQPWGFLGQGFCMGSHKPDP